MIGASLLEQVNLQQQRLAEIAAGRRLVGPAAARLLRCSPPAQLRGPSMDREPIAVRERYGRHAFGQSLLLARRLVEAGVPVVQANMGHVQNWDLHSDIFPSLKKRLLPPLDRGVAALLDDLEVRGLLDETLVVMLGEFGRTPKVTTMPVPNLPAEIIGPPAFLACSPGPVSAAGKSSASQIRSAPSRHNAILARRCGADHLPRAGVDPAMPEVRRPPGSAG